MAFENYLNNQYVQAFLDVLSFCEGTNNRYDVIFGGGRFTGNQHPHRHVRAGGYNSDAAGRYQFLGSTWDRLQRQFGFADFSPRNQDLGAIALIAEKGVLNAIANGDLDTTVRALVRVWPSLPGGHQQVKNWNEVRTYWTNDLAVRGIGQSNTWSNNAVVPNFELPALPVYESESRNDDSLAWSEFFADDFNEFAPPQQSSNGGIIAMVGVVLALILVPRLLE